MSEPSQLIVSPADLGDTLRQTRKAMKLDVWLDGYPLPAGMLEAAGEAVRFTYALTRLKKELDLGLSIRTRDYFAARGGGWTAS